MPELPLAPLFGTGVVVIGRNEGERLARCFNSLRSRAGRVVYVDSGSTDGSVELARTLAIEVVELEMDRPFTAARARNAGLQRLRVLDPDARFVQFVDGDCELVAEWLEQAREFLLERDDVACVCGRLFERFPERSVYNRMCDQEWNRPAGSTDACGGIAMMRIDRFADVGGFNESLVAGEEPELCHRLRLRGSLVWRLPEGMAWHDANMLRFGQWWKRSRRVGFAYAQAVAMHGLRGDRGEWVRVVRPWLWVVVLPAAVVVGTLWDWRWVLLLLAYPASVVRTASRLRGAWSFRMVHSGFLLLAKVPEWLGQWQFWLSTLRGASSAVRFDYKG